MAKIETNLTKEQIAIAEALFGAGYQVTIGKRNGEPTSRVIPMDQFPVNVWEKIVGYGVQRTFNDAVGGSDRTLGDKLEIIDKMIADFREGRVARARTAGDSDPLVPIMRQLAKAKIAEEKKDKKWFKGLDEDALNEKLDARIAERESAYRTQAQKLYDLRRAEAEAKRAIVAGL